MTFVPLQGNRAMIALRTKFLFSIHGFSGRLQSSGNLIFTIANSLVLYSFFAKQIELFFIVSMPWSHLV